MRVGRWVDDEKKVKRSLVWWTQAASLQLFLDETIRDTLTAGSPVLRAVVPVPNIAFSSLEPWDAVKM